MTDTTDQQAVTVAQEMRGFLHQAIVATGDTYIAKNFERGVHPIIITSEIALNAMENYARHRLASVSSASAEIPAGMKPWTGGNGAPDDWDGGSVLRADGQTEHSDDITLGQWKHIIPGSKWNVAAYTPARVLELPEPVPATNQAGEVEDSPIARAKARQASRDASAIPYVEGSIYEGMAACVMRSGRTIAHCAQYADAIEIAASLAAQFATSQEGQGCAKCQWSGLERFVGYGNSEETRPCSFCSLATQPATSQEGEVAKVARICAAIGGGDPDEIVESANQLGEPIEVELWTMFQHEAHKILTALATQPAASHEGGDYNGHRPNRYLPEIPHGASLFAVNPSTGAWHYVNHAGTWQGMPNPLATQPATSQEPFGYWVTQKHADPVLLRKPAYIPEPSDLRTVTPLYAIPEPLPSNNQAREVENLRQALRNIAEGNLGDAPWQANYARIKEVAAEALAATPTPPTLSEDFRIALEKIADNECNSWAGARTIARNALARAQVKIP